MCRYDPHATQFIHFSQVSDFLSSLDPPLGIPKPNTVALVSFNLPISSGNKIHCLDILHALVKHVLGHVEETDNFKQLQVYWSFAYIYHLQFTLEYTKSKLVFWQFFYRNKWTSNSKSNSQLVKNSKSFHQHEFGSVKIKQQELYKMLGEST